MTIVRSYTYNEDHLGRTIGFNRLRYGSSVQIDFVPLPLRFGSEEEIIFSRALSKFQHLMIIED